MNKITRSKSFELSRNEFKEFSFKASLEVLFFFFFFPVIQFGPLVYMFDIFNFEH